MNDVNEVIIQSTGSEIWMEISRGPQVERRVSLTLVVIETQTLKQDR